jgi:hypothetical protein
MCFSVLPGSRLAAGLQGSMTVTWYDAAKCGELKRVTSDADMVRENKEEAAPGCFPAINEARAR